MANGEGEAVPGVGEPAITVHERSWAGYWRGIDSSKNDASDPAASAWRGFVRWVKGFFYRAYSTEDDGTPYDEDVFASPWFPEKLQAHEAAHTRVFGGQFPCHPYEHDPCGHGLDHEPLFEFDLMLPGYLSPLRFSDLRDIRGAYSEWVHDGRVKFVTET